MQGMVGLQEGVLIFGVWIHGLAVIYLVIRRHNVKSSEPHLVVPTMQYFRRHVGQSSDFLPTLSTPN